MDILPHLREHNGETCVLAIRAILRAGNLRILDNLIQHVATDRRLLGLSPLLQCLVDIHREIIGRLLAKLSHDLGDLVCLDSTHIKNLL